MAKIESEPEQIEQAIFMAVGDTSEVQEALGDSASIQEQCLAAA